MNGKVLDSFILQKPAGWEPDFNVRNLFTSYFISNYSTTDFLESTGMQTCSLIPCSAAESPSSRIVLLCQHAVWCSARKLAAPVSMALLWSGSVYGL